VTAPPKKTPTGLRRRKVKVVYPKPDHETGTLWAGINGQPTSLPHDLPEGEFQTTCEEVARMYGWTVYHETDSRKSPKGLPDLIMLSRPQDDGSVVLAMIELKSAKGKLTEEQEVWQLKLSRVGSLVTGWLRPTEWPMLVGLLFDPMSATAPLKEAAPDAPADRVV
jgi:hypothetical protein